MREHPTESRDGRIDRTVKPSMPHDLLSVLELGLQRAVGQLTPDQSAAEFSPEGQAEGFRDCRCTRGGEVGFEGLHAKQFDGMRKRSTAPNARLTVQNAPCGSVRPESGVHGVAVEPSNLSFGRHL